MRRSCLFRVLVLLLVASLAGKSSSALAATIFESGTLGPTGLTFADFVSNGEPKAAGVETQVFSGVRFEITQPVLTSRIGGHFVIEPNNDSSFFGAIVKLDSFADFPDSGDLSTPDVLGATLLQFPSTSAEVYGNLELSLDPGFYALIFGSGLFGATGNGAAVLNNPDIGSQSYIARVPGSGWIEIGTPFGPFENFRLVVEGTTIPEPTTLSIGFLTSTFLLCFRRIRNSVARL